ncbi:MAG: GHKL domain-containing protein [Bacteroidales bacterium]|nr:GHKL domain-containing protein [Bacteroidales bacterium]
MKEEVLPTKFAPSERATAERLQAQVELFSADIKIGQMAEAVSSMLIILNEERQIVLANKLFTEAFGSGNNDKIIGLRPGEAVGCIHATIEPGGCGTSKFCRTCGAVKAILDSQKGLTSEEECQIRLDDYIALDLKVKATPFKRNDESYTIYSISDISDEKRRGALERIFFHDVLNTASGILGLSSLLPTITNTGEITLFSQQIEEATEKLIEEIKAQRELSYAERGDLVPALTKISSLSVLTDVQKLYANHDLAVNKSVVIDSRAQKTEVVTDPLLLRRVIGNMVKNALEASKTGQTVTLSCKTEGLRTTFSVHNEGSIESETQLQLFRRSFSTKGSGRGIGTYSMKLLGEKYLKGRVWFESLPEGGTTFYIEF